MIGTRNTADSKSKPACLARFVGLGALTGALMVAWTAMAQDARSPQPSADPAITAPAAPASDPAFRPGFIDALGRWLGNSKTQFDEGLKGTQDALGDVGAQATDAVKGAAGAAKQATGAIVNLPNARIVIGRQPCPSAPNGAPDCTPAAVALCKYRGFAGGRGVDIDSAQKCPRWVWLQGRTPQENECHTETFVTRAVCQ